MIVSQHAAERYIERVDPTLTLDQARARIAASKAAIDAAAAFGCRVVRQGCGTELRLQGDTVATVTHRKSWSRPRQSWRTA